MNNKSEATDWLAWLLQDLNPTIAEPSGEFDPGNGNPNRGNSDVGSGELGNTDLQFGALDDHLENETAATAQQFQESSRSVFNQTQQFEPGDRPAVQDRFHALLKHRMRQEIERNPPLFPWETELVDYEAEELAVPRFVKPSFWKAQLSNLNLPVPMPEQVLEQLLARCQSLVQTSLQEGVKLVQAVDGFFPNQDSSLADMAGMVLAAPARSGHAMLDRPVIPGMPSHYDEANQTQQMALSLLAAREIFNSLTLVIAPNQVTVERQWETSEGRVTLKASNAANQLRVEATLPSGGKLQFGDDQISTQAQRASAGCLVVELPEPQQGRTYPLQVSLSVDGQPALSFGVQLAAEAR